MSTHGPPSDEEGPNSANTMAITVLFHPDANLAARLGRLAPQICCLIVVANDGGGASRLAGIPNVRMIYLSQGRNAGLAAGLNRGLEAAILEQQYNAHITGWDFYLPRLAPYVATLEVQVRP